MHEWFGPMEKLPGGEQLDELAQQGKHVLTIFTVPVQRDGKPAGFGYMMLMRTEEAPRIVLASAAH